MADDKAAPATRKSAGPRKTAASKPRTSSSAQANTETPTMTQTATTTTDKPSGATGTQNAGPAGDTPGHRSEAKSRFNAAINEAKAGAAALRAEAAERAGLYREQAKERSHDWVSGAKNYGEEAKIKGRDLAIQGKGKVSEGLTALGQAVADSAHVVDERLGAKYGDYARTASRSLQEAATKLDQKSIDELAEDGRAFVRKSPGTAVGIAAVFGFLLSRLFTRSRR
jgi:ElaB/YqjD/DUF883 family membrane-anchored ribosome-binding protein